MLKFSSITLLIQNRAAAEQERKKNKEKKSKPQHLASVFTTAIYIGTETAEQIG